ncbi:MAG: SURF1 family protein [Candidatus Contendobacter sp.]|nr:SURF1 family protein [Candidatus Contendobacter sp.]MDG4557025.1 SURF1 family protein [Candidatus Contendobacter sp.]
MEWGYCREYTRTHAGVMESSGGRGAVRARVGDWVLRPGRASTIATLLVLPLLLTLGFWQLDRARQKAELQAAFADQSRQPPASLAEVNPDDPANRYRRVVAVGRYDREHQLLLDNQVRDGQAGYHVLTPLRLTPGSAILVNRGWLPLGGSRQELPDVAVTAEPITVVGWLAQPTSPGLRLGDAGGSDSRWPRVIPYVDYDRLAALLGYPLWPTVILLEPEASAGYRRDWQPQFGGYGPERHQGYAVQWFALAAALVILYLAANARRLPRSE